MAQMRKSSTSVCCVCSCWTLVNDYASIILACFIFINRCQGNFGSRSWKQCDEIYAIGTASARSMLVNCDLGYNKRNLNRLVVCISSQAVTVPRQSVWIKRWQSLPSQSSQAHRKIEPIMENKHSFSNLLHVSGSVKMIHT